MRLAAVTVLAACGNAAPTPDALPSTIDYRLFVTLDGSRQLPLSVSIDGVQTNDLHTTYERSQEGTTVHHTIELRYQDAVLLRRDVLSNLSSCNADLGNGVLSYEESYEELDSGDLRALGDDIRGVSWVCNGDAFGIAGCWQGAADRCAPVVELAAPLFTRLSWVPAGPKQHGDACAFTDDPAGAYDDCANGLFCYQGSCHTLCLDGAAPAIDGYPREVRICD